MQAEIGTLKEQMKLLISENKDKHEVIKILQEEMKVVENKYCKNCENKNIPAEDVSMHERRGGSRALFKKQYLGCLKTLDDA